MPAKSWTMKGVDREWLNALIPEFIKIHAECVSGGRNIKKAQFYGKVYGTYKDKHFDRLMGAKLPVIGFGGTEEQRRPFWMKVSWL
jgi:hypothetical protein